MAAVVDLAVNTARKLRGGRVNDVRDALVDAERTDLGTGFRILRHHFQLAEWTARLADVPREAHRVAPSVFGVLKHDLALPAGKRLDRFHLECRVDREETGLDLWADNEDGQN